jgi:2-polyprenyl-3-methyl-5-hydroxy-6-metoxy-1,4-benzoquinol methylase
MENKEKVTFNNSTDDNTTITCPCCGNHETALVHKGLTSIFSVKPYDLVRCNSCSNIMTLPMVSAAELQEIYSLTYLYPVHKIDISEKKYRARGFAKLIRKISPPAKETKVFEIGCMHGILLNELKTEYNVSGIEISKEPVRYCQLSGLDVQESSIEDYLKSPTSKYNIIILQHVFEHLLNPEIILKNICDLLLPEGKIFITVPNNRSLSTKLLGRYWGWWQVPVHINHFNKKSLEVLAHNSKLKISYNCVKGGSSLMLLVNFMNLFGYKKKNSQEIGIFKRSIIRFFTIFFRYWYVIGNEEITVVLEKENNSRS